MFVLRRLPAFFAVLMLGALTLRLGLAFLVAVPLTCLVLVLLFLPGRAVQTAISTLLGAGGLAWVAMTWIRVQERITLGQPWLRLTIILSTVALFTTWAAWLTGPRDARPGNEEGSHD